MAETLIIPQIDSREQLYKVILPQIETVIHDETDLIANLANISAILKEAFRFFWVGFYLKKGNQLVLGPFQGPMACTRINFDRGVCGHCYTLKQTIIVPHVEAFPGHIACSANSKSEIVIPIFDKDGNVSMLLDVDSDLLNDFSEIDKIGLEKLAQLIGKI